jgi:hypothetical protein
MGRPELNLDVVQALNHLLLGCSPLPLQSPLVEPYLWQFEVVGRWSVERGFDLLVEGRFVLG